MPSFGRYEQAAELVRRLRAATPGVGSSRDPTPRVDRRWPARRSCASMRRLVVLAVRRGRRASLGGSPIAASAPPAGPPYPEPVDGQAVYDYAGVLEPETDHQAEQIIDAIEAQTRAEVVVYTQDMGRDDVTTDEAEADAGALMDQWGVGRRGHRRRPGDPVRARHAACEHGQVQLYAGAGFDVDVPLDRRAAGDLRRRRCCPLLPERRLRRRDPRRRSATSSRRPSTPTGRTRAGRPRREGPPPGPPFPDPETDRAVYDFAGILAPDAIVERGVGHRRHRGADRRRGRRLHASRPATTASTRRRPRRAPARSSTSGASGAPGFDDGMVIFFDIDPSLEHGQVQLYAAPGFEAAFLSNSERQAIFENDMLPLLRSADFDGALERRARARSTPRRPRSTPPRSSAARQINAVLGLVGAPVVAARAQRLGVLQLAAVRQGPGLPRRPVDPHAGAAARPDRRVRARWSWTAARRDGR